ncbi:PaaI family thioesterase [Actinomadura mexicana]|uniref:Acyl-coenzyme A thioesterase THEM4 n=1 Tax=Actinomadura mexicana TaxID=134959 RepID=A0A239C1P6_9ACTN|nr:PaaI family thioesterase [Actinomadura mexicana]SNS13303.1 Acyl-coenzyme A thioesterase PaaI, contains HGG motif [Actinomadura mexicana]
MSSSAEHGGAASGRAAADVPAGGPALSPHWAAWSREAAERAADGWPAMIEELRALQDAAAGTVPPADAVREASALLARVRELLEPYRVAAADQIFGRLLELPGRGQTLSPPLWITRHADDEITATTWFGPFHEGSHGAAHGGAVSLMFDDALGRVADLGGRPRSRTANLHVDFRSITPLRRRLAVRVRMTEQAGRKRYLQGTLQDGPRLCAEATGLFVEMRPGHQ